MKIHFKVFSGVFHFTFPQKNTIVKRLFMNLKIIKVKDLLQLCIEIEYKRMSATLTR